MRRIVIGSTAAALCIMAALAFSVTAAREPANPLADLPAGKVQLMSAGVLAFGPDGILFVGDSVGGNVYRTYVARTKGFASRELTTEMVADRWNDIMSHADGVTLDVSAGQTLGPNLKPYKPG